VNDAQEGFADYVRLCRGWLRSEAYRLCHDWHEAEDLVQVTLYQVYRRWDQLTARDQLTAYVRRTLLCAYLGERRRPRWRYEISQLHLPEMSEPARTPSVDEQIFMITVLNQLGPRQRTVVALRFYADLSVEQTATAMGCSVGTVTSQTHRALNALRRALT
jgi:RNA polymerase sigma-70 factor (sigma-E family)